MLPSCASGRRAELSSHARPRTRAPRTRAPRTCAPRTPAPRTPAPSARRCCATSAAPSWSTAARDVFGQKGYHAATVDDITRAAGVAKGTFYLYFDEKREVYYELVRSFLQHVKDIGASVAREVHTPAEFFARCEQAARELMRVFLEHHKLARLTYRESMSLDPELERLLRDFYRDLARVEADNIRVGIELGIFRTVDPMICAYAHIGMVERVALGAVARADAARAARRRARAAVDRLRGAAPALMASRKDKLPAAPSTPAQPPAAASSAAAQSALLVVQTALDEERVAHVATRTRLEGEVAALHARIAELEGDVAQAAARLRELDALLQARAR